MTTKITVTPWILTEIPIKVEFSRLGDDTGFIDYPRLYVGDEEIYVPRSWNLEMVLYQVYRRLGNIDPFTTEQREQLDNLMSNAEKNWAWNMLSLHRSFVASKGYPVSLDPNGQYLTVGYPLEPRPLSPNQIDKAIQKFMTLPLNKSGLSSVDERRVLYAFAGEYGLWVPFEPLAKAINNPTGTIRHISSSSVDLSYPRQVYLNEVNMESTGREIVVKHGEAQFDPNASLVAIQEKWRVLVNESFGLPYRHYQDLNACQFRGEWFGWPELMKLWQEASTKMNTDVKKKNDIDDVLLQRMIQTCAVVSKPVNANLPSISFVEGTELVFYMVMSWKSSILNEHFKAYKKCKSLISREFVPHNVQVKSGYEHGDDPRLRHANRVHGGAPRDFSEPLDDEDLLDAEERNWLYYIRRVDECVNKLNDPQNQLIRMCFLDEPKKTQRQAHEQYYKAQGYSLRGIEREIETAKQVLKNTLSKIQIPIV